MRLVDEGDAHRSAPLLAGCRHPVGDEVAHIVRPRRAERGFLPASQDGGRPPIGAFREVRARVTALPPVGGPR
jgi:hypothetical protein